MRISLLVLLFSCFTLKVAAQTQASQNQYVQNNLKSIELELDQLFDTLKIMYQTDKVFLDAMNESQNSWNAWQIAQVKMKYPPRKIGWYGSNHGMCISLYKIDLIKKRLEELSPWIYGIEEGDGCAGTIPKN